MSNSGKYSAVVDEDSEAEYVFDVDEEEEDEDGAMRIELDEITPHNVTTVNTQFDLLLVINLIFWTYHEAYSIHTHREAVLHELNQASLLGRGRRTSPARSESIVTGREMF